jgi:hypothetical protein
MGESKRLRDKKGGSKPSISGRDSCPIQGGRRRNSHAISTLAYKGGACHVSCIEHNMLLQRAKGVGQKGRSAYLPRPADKLPASMCRRVPGLAWPQSKILGIDSPW